MRKSSWCVAAVILTIVAVVASHPHAEGGKQVAERVFEMRTYYAHPGKMDALHERFRKHTCKLFEKHGMTLVGFWRPLDAKVAEEKMVYILAYPSKQAAEKSWKDFVNDPDWKAAKTASEVNGPLVAKVESLYLSPTDYSAVK